MLLSLLVSPISRARMSGSGGRANMTGVLATNMTGVLATTELGHSPSGHSMIARPQGRAVQVQTARLPQHLVALPAARRPSTMRWQSMARWSELRPSNSSCKASLTESVVRPGRLSRARNDDGPSMRRTAARPCSRSVVVVALAHTTCSSFVTRDRYTPLDGRHLIRLKRQCISPS